ncbi:hypothetical protein SLA2020_202830 [Shorea laevis]
MQDRDLTLHNILRLKKALLQYFGSSFMKGKYGKAGTRRDPITQTDATDTTLMNLFVIPSKIKDDPPRDECESYVTALWKLRDQVLSLLLSPYAYNLAFLTISCSQSLFHSVWDM